MLLEKPAPVLQESCRVVLETERLVLRRPTLADVKAIARLANDRRIAQNTARLPHPYAVSDAETFVQFRRQQPRDTNFAITRDGDLLGGIGIDLGKPDAAGDRLLARRSLLGPGLCDRSRARRHRLRLRGIRQHRASRRRPRRQSGLAPRAGEVRLPVDQRANCCGLLSLGCSVPVDRFRLDRGVWTSLKSWRDASGTEVVALRAGDYAGCGVTTGSARASFRSRMKM